MKRAVVVVAAGLLLAGFLAVGALARSGGRDRAREGDLAVDRAAPTVAELARGASLGIVVRVHNAGADDVVGSRLTARLSVDKHFDRHDPAVGAATVPRLSSKVARRVRIAASIPRGIEARGYWLIVCGHGRSPEVKRNNCARSKAIRIVPATGGSSDATNPSTPPSTSRGEAPSSGGNAQASPGADAPANPGAPAIPGAGEPANGPVYSPASASVGTCCPALTVAA